MNLAKMAFSLLTWRWPRSLKLRLVQGIGRSGEMNCSLSGTGSKTMAAGSRMGQRHCRTLAHSRAGTPRSPAGEKEMCHVRILLPERALMKIHSRHAGKPLRALPACCFFNTHDSEGTSSEPTPLFVNQDGEKMVSPLSSDDQPMPWRSRMNGHRLEIRGLSVRGQRT